MLRRIGCAGSVLTMNSAGFENRGINLRLHFSNIG